MNTVSLVLNLLFAVCGGGLIGLAIGIRFAKRRLAPASEAPLSEKAPEIKIGGRLFDTRKLTPELIEELKKEYLLPAATNDHLVRAHLIGTCPEQHSTLVHIGIFGKNPVLMDELVAAIQRGKASGLCSTCGKQSKFYGKQVTWSGTLKHWDGVA